MFTKVIITLAAVALGMMLSIEKPAVSSQAEAPYKEILYGDTYACPHEEAIMSYLMHGITDSDESCSALVWDALEFAESIGEFPVVYVDWFDTGSESDGTYEYVHVYRVKYQGLELYAIIDMIDEHSLDRPVGLRGGIAYTVWDGV